MLRLVTLRGSRAPAIPNIRSSLTDLPVRGLPAPAPWRAATRLASTENEGSEVEKNKHGEIVVYRDVQKHPPKGYSFVRAGKPFIARRSRELTREAEKDVYVLMRRKKRQNSKKQEGFFVPTNILRDAKAQSEQRKERDRSFTRRNQAAAEANSNADSEEPQETITERE